MSNNGKEEKQLSVQEERAEYGKEKPKAKDTARLIWASKPKKEPNAKDLEFQTAEEVYPNVADIKDKKLSRFWTETKDISDDPNRLIWGDNLLVMQALLAQDYEGQIDLIYIDPPFNTGENFNFQIDFTIGNKKFEKELPVQERLAYTDTWERGIDSFLDMLLPRLQIMRRLLSDKGSLFVHCDWHVSHYIRIILDEVFGKENFRNEIVWRRVYTHSDANRFGHIHDVIFFYSKTNNYIWNEQFIPQSEEYLESHYRSQDKEGRPYRLISMSAKTGKKDIRVINGKEYLPDGNAWKYSQETIDEYWKDKKIVFTKEGTPQLIRYLDETEGKRVQTIWTDIFPVNSQALERTQYATQKPEALLDRILKASSNAKSLIGDFFCGSGTTAAVAEKLGRRWIISDLSKTAIQVTRSRLVNQNSNPFVIENLGNYQRQLIYAKEVNLIANLLNNGTYWA